MIDNEMENDWEKVWEKAIEVSGYDPSIVRKDACGAWIIKAEYGNRNSQFGWEIDHIYPQSKGGGNDLINLMPMQWENNLAKGEDFPIFTAVIQAKDSENARVVEQFKVNEMLKNKLIELYSKK